MIEPNQNTKPKKKAVSYLRMSTKKQLNGHSLKRQNETIDQYVKENNLELIETLEDIGLSGFSGANIKKGVLGEFIERINNEEVDKDIVLIVENLDRLSRQAPTRAFSQLVEIIEYGIEIHTLQDRQKYTNETLSQNQGLLFSSIGFMLRAHEESKTKSDRLKKVWKNKRDNIKNKPITLRSPFWLDPIIENGITTRFKLNNKAPLVEDMFNLSIEQNYGVSKLTKYMNDNYSKHRTWNTSTVKRTLNNEQTYGAYTPTTLIDGVRTKMDTIEGYYPPVIDKETYLLNKRMMKERAIHSKGETTSNKNIFSGILKCGVCNGPIRYINKNSKTPEQYLMCSNKLQNKNSCNNNSWKYNSFKESILKYIHEININDILTDTNRDKRVNTLQGQIELLQHEIEDIEKKLDNLFNNLSEQTNKVIVDSLNKKLLTMSKEIEDKTDERDTLNEELNNLQSTHETEVHSDVIALLESSEIDEIVLIKRLSTKIKQLITEIKLYNSDEVMPWDYTIEDLPEGYLEWFSSTRTKRTRINDPIKYLETTVGQNKMREFSRYIHITFKNNYTRVIYTDKALFDTKPFKF